VGCRRAAGGAGDVDDVARHGEVVEPRGVGRAEVDAPVGDVAVPLGTDRPRRRVHVLAAVGDGDVPVHVFLVAVGGVHRDPDRRGVHDDVVRLVEGDVDAAHRRVLVSPGADG